MREACRCWGLSAYRVRVGRACSGAAATSDTVDGDDGLHHAERGDGGSGVRITRLMEKVLSIHTLSSDYICLFVKSECAVGIVSVFLPCGLGGGAVKGGVVSTCSSCIDSDLSSVVETSIKATQMQTLT